MTLALFLLLAASPTFDEAFRAGLLALQRNDLNAAADAVSRPPQSSRPQRPRLGRAGADLLEAERDTAKADDAAAKAATLGAERSAGPRAAW